MTGDGRVTLSEAARALEVHYMTAYRYLRTGRLAGERVGATWRVRLEDVNFLAATPRNGAAPPGRRTSPQRRSARLLERLISGDEIGAWAIVEEQMKGGDDPAAIYDELLTMALTSLGESWARGQVTVAQEHRATVVAARVVARLGPSFRRRGRTRGTVVLGTVAGDPHALPGAMLADRLRGIGFEPLDLGADAPPEAFVETARAADRLVAVLVGATTRGHERVLRSTLGALRRSEVASPVFIGGRGVVDEASALTLGAAGWTGHDAPRALAVLTALVESSPHPRARATEVTARGRRPSERR